MCLCVVAQIASVYTVFESIYWMYMCAFLVYQAMCWGRVPKQWWTKENQSFQGRKSQLVFQLLYEYVFIEPAKFLHLRWIILHGRWRIPPINVNSCHDLNDLCMLHFFWIWIADLGAATFQWWTFMCIPTDEFCPQKIVSCNWCPGGWAWSVTQNRKQPQEMPCEGIIVVHNPLLKFYFPAWLTLVTRLRSPFNMEHVVLMMRCFHVTFDGSMSSS